MRTAEEIIKENGWDKTVAEIKAIKAIQADAWQDAIKHAISIAKRYSGDDSWGQEKIIIKELGNLLEK